MMKVNLHDLEALGKVIRQAERQADESLHRMNRLPTGSGTTSSIKYLENRLLDDMKRYQQKLDGTKMLVSITKSKVEKTERELQFKAEDIINGNKQEVDFNKVCKIESKEKEKLNMFEKSWESFKGIGQDIGDGFDNRNNKKFDSTYDFTNYLTLGALDGGKAFWSGLSYRSEQSMNSVYDFTNYWTLGGVDLVRSSVNPDEPFSKEHWLSSLGLAASVTGITGSAFSKVTGGPSRISTVVVSSGNSIKRQSFQYNLMPERMRRLMDNTYNQTLKSPIVATSQYAKQSIKNWNNLLRPKTLAFDGAGFGPQRFDSIGNIVELNRFDVEGKGGSVGTKGTGKDYETSKLQKWSNDGKYDKVRAYRGRDLTEYNSEYLVDPRLVVEMNFKGKAHSGTNAAGWERNAKKFFNSLLKSNPEFWSTENTALIKRGRVPKVDEQFLKHFPQYNEYIQEPMRHHHIGEGGQAVALPKSLHPGYGGIHNVEKDWGITGVDDEIARRLDSFIKDSGR
ncbi:hypothetical protein [Aquibacillus kalidii]|uniref:hypothetical protein n=1 Tax=Aquibacillus kalidii TaxID=2762597 RepID=UPI001F2359E1|nr:hypothetical protein [Aquibacillus kalidii]